MKLGGVLDINPKIWISEAGRSTGALFEAGPWAAFAAIVPAGLLAVIGWWGTWELPAASVTAQSSKVLAADGQVIATLHGEENRTIVPLEKISKNLIKAVVATEDKGFYEHAGVSVRGIIRAARANLEGKQIVQGGSTITQQYVRNAYPSIGTEKTIARKLKESWLALRVEQRNSKAEILEKYLNLVYFGRGAYGAEAAARTYFKVPASDLTVGQAAYLAGVIRSPERYQIGTNLDESVALRNKVLSDMMGAGYITKAQAEAARREDLKAQFKPGQSIEVESSRAGFFVEYVRQLLRREFQLTDEQILGGGLQIHTSLDLRMQDAAEAAITSVLDRPTDPEAALVAMDGQGHVKAMVGGRDVGSIERARGFNFAVDAQGTGGGRPAGSAFKVFALAALVEEGYSISSTFSGPSTIRIDSPQCRNKDGTPWEVSNFGNAGFGALDVNRATLSSVNTVYAQIMESAVNPSEFMAMAEKTGITIPAFDAGCALTLGTTDVTPMEMARAYTTFAQRGKRPEPILITKITSPRGEVIAERTPKVEQVIDPNVADTVNHVLQQNITGGTGTGARIGRPAAGKTGTTQNHENAWFAGYTPQLTAVVWMGYPPQPDGTIPLLKNVRGRDVTGGSFPATIWKKFMTVAVEGTEKSSFVKPKLGGKLATPLRHFDTGEGAEASGDRAQSSNQDEDDDDDDDDAPPPTLRDIFDDVESDRQARNVAADGCSLLRTRSCESSEEAPEEEPAKPNNQIRSAEELGEEIRRSINAGD
jgi:penicillin-binding protein 1A